MAIFVYRRGSAEGWAGGGGTGILNSSAEDTLRALKDKGNMSRLALR